MCTLCMWPSGTRAHISMCFGIPLHQAMCTPYLLAQALLDSTAHRAHQGSTAQQAHQVRRWTIMGCCDEHPVVAPSAALATHDCTAWRSMCMMCMWNVAGPTNCAACQPSCYNVISIVQDTLYPGCTTSNSWRFFAGPCTKQCVFFCSHSRPSWIQRHTGSTRVLTAQQAHQVRRSTIMGCCDEHLVPGVTVTPSAALANRQCNCMRMLYTWYVGGPTRAKALQHGSHLVQE